MSNISGGTQRPRRSQQTRLTEKLAPETKPRQPAMRQPKGRSQRLIEEEARRSAPPKTRGTPTGKRPSAPKRKTTRKPRKGRKKRSSTFLWLLVMLISLTCTAGLLLLAAPQMLGMELAGLPTLAFVNGSIIRYDAERIANFNEAVALVKSLRDGEHIKAAEAAAASKTPAAEKKEAADANAPLDFEKIAASIPAIEVVDMGVTYKQRDPESPKFVTIGERIHCISPVIREAMNTMNPEPILKRAAEQIKAGATYLDVNIGPAESNGPELMTWAVKLLQENFNNVPLALDTANKKAIEAGIKVYNRTNGKPIVNSADAGSRISYIDLAAANDAICIALCSADGIAKDNEERMMHCHHMLERGLSLGMEATDLWFDPLFLVVKGMQDKQMDVLNAIKLFADEGLKSTGGLSNNSNGAPKNVRPIMDSALVAMAMMQGLTSAIVNPNDLRLMETIKSCDIFKNNELYSDSYLDA